MHRWPQDAPSVCICIAISFMLCDYESWMDLCFQGILKYWCLALCAFNSLFSLRHARFSFFYFSSAAVAAAAVARLVSSAETTHTHMQTFFLPNKWYTFITFSAQCVCSLHLTPIFPEAEECAAHLEIPLSFSLLLTLSLSPLSSTLI